MTVLDPRMGASRGKHPAYHRPVSLLWWTRRRSYLLFVLRELSSVFVAWFVAYLLLLIIAIGGGSESYQRFLDWSAQPWLLAVNIVSLAFVLLHAVTWFSLAAKAIVLRPRGRQVPPRAVSAAHFAAWAVLSVAVAWLVLR